MQNSKRQDQVWNTGGATSGTTTADVPSYQIAAFPTALGGTRYPHYMIFYVNRNMRSKIDAGGNTPVPTDHTGSANTSGIPENNSDAKKTTITSAVAESMTPGTFKNSWKRTNTAIALPMPNNVTTNFGMDYSTLETGMLGSMFRDWAAGKSFKEIGTSAANGMIQDAPRALAVFGLGATAAVAAARAAKSGGVVNGAVAGASGAAAIGLSSDTAKKVLGKIAGVAVNRRQEQVFEKVIIRKFQFEWTFAPESAAESTAIQNIIRLFKLNAHPELDVQNSYYLTMPNEFDIEFRYQGGTNDALPKIATGAITDVSVNYTPTGQFAAFSGGGSPVMIHLGIGFTEMEPLTRNMITEGY